MVRAGEGEHPAKLGPYNSPHPQSILSINTARLGNEHPEHDVVSALQSWPQIRARNQGIGTRCVCVSFKCGRHPLHPSRAAVRYLHPAPHQGSAGTASDVGDSSCRGHPRGREGRQPTGAGHSAARSHEPKMFLLKNPFATPSRDAGLPSSWCTGLGALAGGHGGEGNLQGPGSLGFGITPPPFLSSLFPCAPGCPAEIPAAPPTTAASSAEEPAGTFCSFGVSRC